MLLMVPIAYISLISFDLIALITGGLIQNFQGLSGGLGGGGRILIVIIGIFLGILIICLFPIHWLILSQPGNWLLLLALLAPWVITCFITSYMFSHSPRGGIHTSMAIGLGFFFLMLIPYLILSVLLAPIGGAAIIDNISIGLTGYPFVLSVFFATMEGAGVGAVFGALAGSLKYKAGGKSKKEKKKKKSKKKKKDYEYIPEPTFDSSTTSSGPTSSSDVSCTNCGSKLLPGDDFCTKCGTKQ